VITCQEPRLATLHELQTIYSLEDLYDFLEIIEVREAILMEDKAQRDKENKGR
jgi:hypothetical protein